MNITYTQNIKECTFEEIKVGECFEVEGLVHLKIDKFIDFANDEYNCFCFDDNQLYRMFENDEIIPVEAELHVRYKKE